MPSLRAGLAAFVLLAASGLLSQAGAGGAECDPYPIGRCGAYNREEVVFCYVLVQGTMVSATDHEAVSLGTTPLGYPTGVGHVDEAQVHVRADQVKDFLADPTGHGLPLGTVWEEDNHIPGLQTEPFRCGLFVWFNEFEPAMWMGPVNTIDREPDRPLV